MSMITVRFQSGLAVQYNSANYCVWGFPHKLYTRQDGQIVASVPNECIIEFIPVSRVYNAIGESELAKITADIRLIKRKLDRVAISPKRR